MPVDAVLEENLRFANSRVKAMNITTKLQYYNLSKGYEY